MAGRKSMRPGWFPDPSVDRRFRWWDGSAWTRWVATERTSAFPPPGGDRVVPVRSRRDKIVRALWVGLLAILVTSIVMAAIGMRINRANDPGDAPSVPISEAPKVREITKDIQFHTDGKVGFSNLATMQLPMKGMELSKETTAAPGLFVRVGFSIAPEGPTDVSSTGVLVGYVEPLFLAENREQVAASLLNNAARRLWVKAKDPNYTLTSKRTVDTWGEKHPAAEATGQIVYTDAKTGKQVTDKVGFTVVKVHYDVWIGVLWIDHHGVDPAKGKASAAAASTLKFHD